MKMLYLFQKKKYVKTKYRLGIGIPELQDHAERQSAFNTSSKLIVSFRL